MSGDIGSDGAEVMAASWQRVIDRHQPFSGYLLEELRRCARPLNAEEARLNFQRACKAAADRVKREAGRL